MKVVLRPAGVDHFVATTAMVIDEVKIIGKAEARRAASPSGWRVPCGQDLYCVGVRMVSDDSRWPHLASTNDIEQWASTLVARSKFPSLVRRIIEQTNDQILQFEMRADEGVGAPGYDGTSEAGKSTPFVPAGKVVWELGTNLDPPKKANEDYAQRKIKPLHVVPAETTFVFVTLRRWKGKLEWANKKKLENFWKDVRALDVDDIDQALDQAPAVRYWLSEIIGKPANGVQTVEDWWESFSIYTNPRLSPEMVLAGRADEAAALMRMLEEEVRHTLIRARSADDVLAFVASTILTAEPSIGASYLARALIVHDAATLRHLDGTWNLLILMPYEERLRRAAELVRNHHVIFLCTDDGDVDLSLRDIGYDEFKQLVVEVGVSEERALELTRAAARGLTAFRRTASNRGKQIPSWAGYFKDRCVRRSWLIGGWNARRSGDVDVLESVLETSFGDAEDLLIPTTKMEDPIFSVVGSVWGAITREVSWEYVRQAVSSSDLEALERALQTVLGAIDPSLDLPIVDRWQAGVLGKSRIHSSELRKSLAQTLALLGSRNEQDVFLSGQTGPAWSRQVVASLLNRANEDPDAQLWSSLADVLPLIAEAAPEVFIAAVRRATEGLDPAIKNLFIDSTAAFSINSPHTGLLWGLEGLAWPRQYLGQVASILVRLVEIDPGGRLSNRPIASLTNLFLPRFSQTYASTSDKIEVLDIILSRSPGVGWRLILELIPSAFDLMMPHHTFTYRKWTRVEDRRSDYEEVSNMISAIADHALRYVTNDPIKWKDLAEQLSQLPEASRVEAYSILNDLEVQGVSDEDRADVYESLMQQVRHHRSFADAAWSLPEEELTQLESAVAHIQPGGLIEQHRWLFDSWYPDLGTERTEDLEAYDTALAERRASAVAEIYNNVGLAGIDRMIVQVEQVWQLGFALAQQQVAEVTDIIERLASDVRLEIDFSLGFVMGRTRGDFQSLKELVEQIQALPAAHARMLLLCREHTLAWEYVAILGEQVEKVYWKEFQPYGLGADYSLVNEAATRLINHGRPAAALDLISIYGPRSVTQIDASIAVDAIDAILDGADPEIARLRNYALERVLEIVRASQIDTDTIAQLEWRLLPAMGFEARSPALDRKLASDPAFFVEVITLFMRPRQARDEPEVTEAVATNAYRLLHNWKLVPGTAEDTGSIDQARLHSWVVEARRLLVEADRLDIGDQYIGQILARSTIDDDAWPEKSVREVIESVASSHIEQGLYIGIVNKRGMTTRGAMDGGDQERVLAETYSHWASQIELVWPRTAAVLHAVEQRYRDDAAREDEEVERIRRGLSDE